MMLFSVGFLYSHFLLLDSPPCACRIFLPSLSPAIVFCVVLTVRQRGSRKRSGCASVSTTLSPYSTLFVGYCYDLLCPVAPIIQKLTHGDRPCRLQFTALKGIAWLLMTIMPERQEDVLFARQSFLFRRRIPVTCPRRPSWASLVPQNRKRARLPTIWMSSRQWPVIQPKNSNSNRNRSCAPPVTAKLTRATTFAPTVIRTFPR